MKTLRPRSPEPFASLDAVLACLEQAGSLQYSGEPVSHREHALQTAAMAQRARATPALVAAALLHDIGHLAESSQRLADTPSLLGIDDRHEEVAARLLSRLFGPEVIEPIRLHVEAKRYLVSISADYARALSPDSQRSLRLQGGTMSREEAAVFRQLPHADAALRLRCWDDLAKEPSPSGLRCTDFRDAIERALLTNSPHGKQS